MGRFRCFLRTYNPAVSVLETLNYQGAVAGVISGFVVDLGWLLTGMTDATGIFEIIPGFFASLLIAVVVANLTAEPNEKAVEIFEQGIKAETE